MWYTCVHKQPCRVNIYKEYYCKCIHINIKNRTPPKKNQCFETFKLTVVRSTRSVGMDRSVVLLYHVELRKSRPTKEVNWWYYRPPDLRRSIIMIPIREPLLNNIKYITMSGTSGYVIMNLQISCYKQFMKFWQDVI